MKIVLFFRERVKASELSPRDFRNLLGSLAREEDKDLVMWHERKPSPIIFGKPFGNTIDIYTYQDELMEPVFDDLVPKLLKLKEIKLGGLTLHIDKILYKSFSFPRIEKGLFQYKILSPVIYGASKTDFFNASLAKDNKEALHNMIRSQIFDSVAYQAEHYTGQHVDVHDSMIIFHDDFKNFVVHTDDERFNPAFTGTITTDFRLPHFIGYKFGLGYGQVQLLGAKHRAEQEELNKRKGA